MKKIHLQQLVFLLIIFCSISCKSQQTYSLNTDYDNIASGSYIKDLNNELNPYIGTYISSFQGNEITLFITKEENRLTKRPQKQFYRDALVIKYIIKNSSGAILQDTKNNTLDYNELYSIRSKPSQNSVILSYSGTNCGVGWGKVILKKLNATQVSWEYLPNDMIIDSSRCPNGTDLKIYLPETKDLIFTKQ